MSDRTEPTSTGTTTDEHPPITLRGKLLGVFTAVNAIVILSLCGVAVSGGSPSAFMWVRALLLVAVAVLLHLLARRAEAGSSRALRRLRIIATILPIAIIGIDLIPGICPPWYAVLQGIGAAALIPVAVLGRRAERIADHRAA